MIAATSACLTSDPSRAKRTSAAWAKSGTRTAHDTQRSRTARDYAAKLAHRPAGGPKTSAAGSSGRRDPEEFHRLAQRPFGAELRYVGNAQAWSHPVEERDVRPQRLERRPPAQSTRPAAIEREGLRLRHDALARGDAGRPQPASGEQAGIVEIHEVGPVVELDHREREGQAAASQNLRYHHAATKTGQLLDDRRHRLRRQVQAPIDVGVVVPSVALVAARKPQRTALRARAHTAVPGEAAVQRQAKDSARSARIARSSSSARPARTRSIGLRSPRCGFNPKSQARAAAGSYCRRRLAHTSSSRSIRSALSGSMPAPRSQRVTCERFTPSRSAIAAPVLKSRRSARIFDAVARGTTTA